VDVVEVSRATAPRLAGCVVILAAAFAAAAAAVPGRLGLPGSSSAIWALAAALAVAGLVLVVRPLFVRPVAVVIAILGGQLAGHGLVAVRDWFNINGAVGIASHDLATVVTFAAGMAVGGAVATCVGVGLSWRDGLARPRPWWVVAGVLVTVALPPMVGVTIGDSDLTTLGQVALMYAIPWGAGLAVTGWLDGPASTAARTAVVGSVLIVVLS